MNTKKQIGLAQMEEVEFFRSFNWDDERIAQRLGIKLESLKQMERRHAREESKCQTQTSSST